MIRAASKDLVLARLKSRLTVAEQPELDEGQVEQAALEILVCLVVLGILLTVCLVVMWGGP